MAHSVLSRISSTLSPQHSVLSPLQDQVDGLVRNFVDHATDWKSLSALTAGSVAYRLGRLGAPFGNRILATGLGLGAEVSAFEWAHRSLSEIPNLWRWSGSQGLKAGLLSSLITFGSIKGFGNLTRGQNVILRHGAQDLGMVLGHQIAYRVGSGPKPTGSFSEQLIHAEATTLQLEAGMALAHGLAPRMTGLEKGLDLSLQTQIPLHPPFSKGEPGYHPPLKKGGWGDLVLAEGPDVSRSKPLIPLLPIAESRGGNAVGISPAAFQGSIKAALGSLRNLKDLVEEMSPEEGSLLLMKLARASHGAGFPQTAADLVRYALEVSAPIVESRSRVESLIEMADLLLLVRRPDKADPLLRIAAAENEKLPLHTRADFLGKIGLLHSKIPGKDSAEIFLKALGVLEAMEPQSRPACQLELARQMIEAGDLSLARSLLDKISPGGSFKSYALSDLALRWAQIGSQGPSLPGGLLGLSLGLFREARVDLADRRSSRSALGRSAALHDLARKLNRAGPDFRDEAEQVFGELRESLEDLPDGKSRQYGIGYLAQGLSERGEFEQAHELIRRKIDFPVLRSELFKDLALKALEKGQRAEAGILTATVKLFPADRFDVYLKLAESLDGQQPDSRKEKRLILEEARDYILTHEFRSPTRWVQGAIDLGRRFIQMKAPERAFQLFKAAERVVESSLLKPESQESMRGELALARWEAWVLPYLGPASKLHLNDMVKSANSNSPQEAAGAAILLGFRRDSFHDAFKKAQTLPETERDLAIARLLLGGSLRLMETEERNQWTDQVEGMLRNFKDWKSSDPAKVHRILLRALWNLAPQRLEVFLKESIHESLESTALFFPTLSPGILWASPFKGDRILYQNLSWLARYGSYPGQGLVSEFISSQHVPPDWALPLGRSLRIHGYDHPALPKILN